MASFIALSLLLAFHSQLLPPVHAAQGLSLLPGWTFSKDLSFPSSSSSSSLNSHSAIAPFSIFLSIISSTSFDAGSKGFSLGFLSLFDSSASSPTRIYFSICLGVAKNGPSSRPFLVPVWTQDDSTPLQQQGQSGFVKLEVNEKSELLLQDGDGRVVWRVSNVKSMEMQDNGNLVIYNASNQTLWQSFDYPSDTLLGGQQFRLGMELTSNNHMYKVVMQAGGLVFYLVSANPLPLVYGVLTANVTVGLYFNDMMAVFDLNASAPINLTSAMASPSCANSSESKPYALLDGNLFAIHGACGASDSAEFGTSDLLRLDADGNFRNYYLQQVADSTYDITSSLEDFKPCYAPNVCGAYGICTVSNIYGNNIQRFCRCPSEDDNTNLKGAFRFIDASNPSQGCAHTEILECKSNSTQGLIEIKNVASVAMLYLFELTWKENTIPLEQCKATCSSDCSCTGFLYHTKSSFCLPFGETTGISNLSLIASSSSEEHVAYLKIQLKSSPSHIKKLLPIMVSSVLLALALIITTLVVITYRKWKQNRDPESRLAEQQLLGVMPTLPTRFSYQELSRFTKGFSTQLGSGAFGSVYAGTLPDGRTVAVKKLQLLSHGQKEFLAEIATIGGISHVNIVHLSGFCLEKQHRLLVYEYMENGSLDKWLFCKKGQQELEVMSWETRFHVALSTARGLAFLHEECLKPILHFDVKPQNILLDGNFNAKLADFGLAKLVAGEQSSVMTAVRGTPGYIAPEWVSQSIVSRKCDVYSFGMVLLELVSGRRNVENAFEDTEEYYFPTWAVKMTREGRADELLDKRLVEVLKSDVKNDDDLSTGVIMMEQVKRAVGVALMCIHEKPEMRPSMTGVCKMLDGSMAVSEEVLLVATAPPSVRVTSSGSSRVIGHSSSCVEPR